MIPIGVPSASVTTTLPTVLVDMSAATSDTGCPDGTLTTSRR